MTQQKNPVPQEVQPRTVLTHHNTDMDELVPLHILIRDGKSFGYPVSNLQFVSNSKHIVEFVKNNPSVIALGVANSEFDEHFLNGKNGDNTKEKKSCSLMFGNKLGITKGSVYSANLAYADTSNRIVSHLGDLNGLVKLSYLQPLNNETEAERTQRVFKWVFEILDRKVRTREQEAQAKVFRKQLKGKHFSKEEINRVINNFSFKPFKVKRFVLPEQFTVNHVAATKFAQIYGAEIFGVDYRTPVRIVNTEHYRPQKGDLCIGFGNSPFAILPMEKMLKVCNPPENHDYHLVVKYIQGVNRLGGYDPYKIAGLLADRLFDNEGKGTYDDYLWTANVFKILIRKQMDYNRSLECFTLAQERGDIEIIVNYNKDHSRSLRTACIRNVYQNSILNVALSESGGNCDIVFLKNNDSVVIQMKKKYNGGSLIMRGIIASLRVNEMIAIAEKNGQEPIHLSKEDKEVSGTLGLVDAWHYHQEGQAILNRSYTHPDATKTILRFGKIKAIVLGQGRRFLKTN